MLRYEDMWILVCAHNSSVKNQVEKMNALEEATEKNDKGLKEVVSQLIRYLTMETNHYKTLCSDRTPPQKLKNTKRPERKHILAALDHLQNLKKGGK